MDSLDSASFDDGSSTVNLGSDLGPLGDAASPSTQASWDQAMADAGLDAGSGDDMGWGGADGGVPTLTIRASASGDGPNAPGVSAADAAGHAEAMPDTGKSFWQSIGDFLTDPHTVLGAASFAPSVFGSAASAADGLLYAAQGKYTDAGLSLGTAAVGVVSDAGAARLAAKGIKAGAEALTAGHAGEAVVHAVEAERVGQAGGTVAHAAEGATDAEKAAQATKDAEHATGTVWDFLKPTQEPWPGTAIPRSFEMSLGNQTQVWVHGNATEHLAEYATSMLNRGVSRDLVNVESQTQMRSLQAAAEAATAHGIPYDKLVQIEGWELKFAPPRAEGQLPALIHALPLR